MNEFVLLSVLEFDEGTWSAQPLHRGDAQSCEDVAQMIGALSYSGGKAVSRGYLKAIDADTFDEMREEQESRR